MSRTTAPGDDAAGEAGALDRFHEWRRGRPFLGGVLLLLAGVIIAYVPLHFATELLLVGGAFTFIGLVFAVFVALTGVFALARPDMSTMIGTVGIVMSILSIFGALGGLGIGLLVGILGGNLCVAWVPPDDADTGDADAESDFRWVGDDRRANTDD